MFSKRQRNNVDKDRFIGHFIYFFNEHSEEFFENLLKTVAIQYPSGLIYGCWTRFRKLWTSKCVGAKTTDDRNRLRSYSTTGSYV